MKDLQADIFEKIRCTNNVYRIRYYYVRKDYPEHVLHQTIEGTPSVHAEFRQRLIDSLNTEDIHSVCYEYLGEENLEYLFNFYAFEPTLEEEIDEDVEGEKEFNRGDDNEKIS